MKNWLTFALTVAGLAFVLYFQVVQRLQAVEPSRDAVTRERPVPQARPAAPKVAEPRQKFGEYPCSGDCSEQKGGYRWAQMNNITDPDDCTGNSGAFIEGCRVYARQHKTRTADD